MPAFFTKINRGPLRTIRVNLGPCTVSILVADIKGNRPGKTLLVTGGMDGDEAAGMAAAYRLIDAHADGDFAGRLIVVPIVNIPGFEASMSRNPMDDVYPKHVFPGKAKGKPTERLMHWLVSQYAQRADAWHDMHGAALTEGLRPFVWLKETGVTTIDQTMSCLEDMLDTDVLVRDRAGMFSKEAQLARSGCAYVLAECGMPGSDRVLDVERHLVWAHATMQVLGMVPSTLPQRESRFVCTRVDYYVAPFDGWWEADPALGSTVHAGDRLGAWRRLDGSVSHDVYARADGLPLWWKTAPHMHQGDAVSALGLP